MFSNWSSPFPLSESKIQQKSKSSNDAKKENAFSTIFLTGNGATSHFTVRDEWLVNNRDAHIGMIKVADNSDIPVECSGDIEMQTSVNGSVEHIKITDALCVPKLTTNLLSVSQLVTEIK